MSIAIKVVTKSPMKNAIEQTFRRLRYRIDESSKHIVFFPRPFYLKEDFKSFKCKPDNFGFVIFYKEDWTNTPKQIERKEWFDDLFKKASLWRSLMPLEIEDLNDLMYMQLKVYSRALEQYRNKEMERRKEIRKKRRQRRKANSSGEAKDSFRF